MNKKKLIILISIIICLAALVCVGLFAVSKGRAAKIEDKLDLGEKYLEDLKYEKALAAYKEVLQIDPKSVDAYLGMAEVYIAMGEYEEALDILEEGYEETESRKLERKIEEVEALMELEKELEAKAPEATEAPLPTEEPQVTEAPEEVVEETKVAVEVTVEYVYEDIYLEEMGMPWPHEGAIIEGLAEDGSVVWRYEVTKYPKLDLGRMFDLGFHGNVYYFIDKGILIAFEATTGKILWQTEWTDTSLPFFTFDEEGTMYLCGLYGPDLLIVDTQGNVLKRVETLNDEYYWPYKVEVNGNYVFITFDKRGEGEVIPEGQVLSYCLTDGTVGYGYEAMNENLFDMLPLDFAWNMDIGNWESYFHLESNGWFDGGYYDLDMGDTADEYPNGTMYSNTWRGCFNNVQMIEENVYYMCISELSLNVVPGIVTYEGGFRNILTDSVGMAAGDEFLVFLPGAYLENPQDLNINWGWIGGETNTVPAYHYIIYNISQKIGFIGKSY